MRRKSNPPRGVSIAPSPQALSGGSCIGPAPAPIERIKNKTRWQILVKAGRKYDPNGNRAAKVLMKVITQKQQEERSVQILVNRDPVSLM
ncbi:MAG: hypothetical protein U5N26_02280 [Candidatus Marinimicrobia bacterium]|nr:hypothetical protein [Candidatus Neomarinimicrobiota bacterium]